MSDEETKKNKKPPFIPFTDKETHQLLIAVIKCAVAAGIEPPGVVKQVSGLSAVEKQARSEERVARRRFWFSVFTEMCNQHASTRTDIWDFATRYEQRAIQDRLHAHLVRAVLDEEGRQLPWEEVAQRLAPWGLSPEACEATMPKPQPAPAPAPLLQPSPPASAPQEEPRLAEVLKAVEGLQRAFVALCKGIAEAQTEREQANRRGGEGLRDVQRRLGLIEAQLTLLGCDLEPQPKAPALTLVPTPEVPAVSSDGVEIWKNCAPPKDGSWPTSDPRVRAIFAAALDPETGLVGSYLNTWTKRIAILEKDKEISYEWYTRLNDGIIKSRRQRERDRPPAPTPPGVEL